MSTLKVKICDIDQKHPEYIAYAPFLRTIHDLRKGSLSILNNLDKYIPKRPDEDDKVYKLRKEKFSYTPVMLDTINKYTSKLVTSPIHVTSNDKDATFWQKFRENNGGATNRNEKELIKDIFSNYLYYKTCWLAVDKPETVKVKSLYEEERLIHQNAPYILLYNPLNVIHWGSDWSITRQFKVITEPLKPSVTKCIWVIRKPNENIVYEAEVELKTCIDCQGNAYEDIDKVKVGNEWVKYNDEEAVVTYSHNWVHNLGKPLISKSSVSDEQWVCLSVYLKQIQHLRIENAWTDAGYLSGIVQRLYTPNDPSPSDDPRITYNQPDYSKELIPAGNSTILIGKSYSFVESTGSALSNLEKQLDKIESQIRYLISLQFASGQVTQSGVSKQVDMSLFTDAMVAYGQKVISQYKDVLELVALVMGKEKPGATGLDSYSTDQLNDLLSVSLTVDAVDTVPNTAKKHLKSRLLELLNPSLPPGVKDEINRELEAIYTPPDTEKTGEEITEDLDSDTLYEVEYSDDILEYTDEDLDAMASIMDEYDLDLDEVIEVYYGS